MKTIQYSLCFSSSLFRATKRNFCKWEFILIVLFCHLLGLGSVTSANAKDLKVVTSEYPPFSYTENGQVRGVAAAVVQALLDKVGMNQKISVYPWSRALKTAAEEKNTLIFTIARTPEREDQFEWIGVITEGDTFLFASKDRDDIVVTTLADAKKYRVGAVRNGIRSKYLSQNGITRLEEATDTLMNARKMQFGRMDLWAEDEYAACFALQQLRLDPRDHLKKAYKLDLKLTGYLAVSKGSDASLVKTLKEAYAELKNSGEYDRLIALNRPFIQTDAQIQAEMTEN